MSENRALILIDFINDIVHPDGELSGKGYRKTIMPISNHPANKALHVFKKNGCSCCIVCIRMARQ